MVVWQGGAGSGLAALEGLSLQREEPKEARRACAALLLERAAHEATAAGQQWLVVRALPPSLQVQGAEWLHEAGFRDASDATPDAVRRAMGAGAVYRRLV